MIIVGNIGNTNSEFALANDAELVSAPEQLATADLLSGTIPNLLQTSPNLPIWLVGVVPDARDLDALKPATWIAADQCRAIDFSSVDTRTLGADRIANVAAAAALLKLPALIIDCGTAITFELINDGSAFCGGAILPGRQLMRSALHSGTAQLPDIPMDSAVPEGAGTTTRDAIAVGVDAGVIGAVQAVRKHILAGITPPVTTYVTGGDALFFLERLEVVEAVPPHFTLKGVAAIAAQHAQ